MIRASRRGTNALVIGASGFIGRALCAELSGMGVVVKPLSRSSGFDVLRDRIDLEAVDHVFHLAASTGVQDAWSAASEFHLLNAHGTMRVAEQCARAEKPLVFVSAYVYGQPDRLPIDEAHPVRPSNPYAASKWMGEVACRWLAENEGLPLTIIRLFNAYGTEQSSRFLIPHLVRQLLDPSIDAIEVQDSEPKRDYVHIDDVVRALVQVVPEAGTHCFNVGSGESHSVTDILTTLFSLARTAKPIVDRKQRRRNEIMDVIADCRSLSQACGWSPQVGIRDGLARLLEAERDK